MGCHRSCHHRAYCIFCGTCSPNRKPTMLRQAMDAAEGRLQEQRQQEQQHSHDETSRLLLSQEPPPSGPLTPLASGTTGYGTPHDEYDNDDNDDDDEEGSLLEDSYADDDWSDSQQPNHQRDKGIARKTWDAIRNLFMLVANVENLWDSPLLTTGGVDAAAANGGSTISGSYPTHQRNGGSGATTNTELSLTIPSEAHLRTRSYLIVLFWFVVLAGAYASERSTFKLLVDRAGPFRLFSVEMVTLAHASLLGSWMVISNLYHNRQQQRNDANNATSWIPLGIPLVDVGCKSHLVNSP